MGQWASLTEGYFRKSVDGFVALVSERGAQPVVDSGSRRFATAASIRRERVSGFFALSMARTCSRGRSPSRADPTVRLADLVQLLRERGGVDFVDPWGGDRGPEDLTLPQFVVREVISPLRNCL